MNIDGRKQYIESRSADDEVSQLQAVKKCDGLDEY